MSDSTQLFKWNRFDLPIKKLFLAFHDKRINSSFGEDIYREHLRVWNGFKEYNNPSKNTYEEFKTDFINIFNDIKNNQFDWDKSPISIDSQGRLLNGAHRAAAASYLNTKSYARTGLNIHDGQMVCDYRFFQNLGLQEKYQDAAALELARTNKNLRVVSLFPSAENDRGRVDSLIKGAGAIAYKKDIDLNQNGAFHYMLHLYKGEAWAGNWSNNFAGFIAKRDLCFTTNAALTVYLVEFDDLDAATRVKQEIRDLYKIGNHSVHINDTHEETLRVSRCVFNDNSIHFMNKAKLRHFSSFLKQLDYYTKYLNQHSLDTEEYCITASSVLSLYGLREGVDLDYLHFNNHVIEGHSDIHSHNEYGVGRYHIERDDIIFNPSNHFYFDNIKLASLNVVKELKERRGEPKDLIDTSLIRSVL